MIAAISHMEGNQMTELSEVLFNKTHGNPFFVVQFVELLQQQGLLWVESEGNWTWDIDRILSETDVSDNVVELVAKRIQALPETLRDTLRVAAFLGFWFEVDVLAAVLGAKHEEIDNTSLANTLKEGVIEGLLERSGETRYKFSHDRIQQCLYLVTEEAEERKAQHLQIGRVLKNWKATHSKEGRDQNEGRNTLLVLATDHLNLGSSLIEEEAEVIELARMNLKSAKRSVQNCSFGSTVEYLQKALSLLDREGLSPYERWEKHYSLCLQIVSLWAHVELSRGNFEKSTELCDEVLRYGKTLRDKMAAYTTKVVSLGTQIGKVEEALAAGRSVLNELGVSIPKKVKKPHLILEMIGVKRLLRGKSDKDLLSLPKMQDRDKVAALGICYTLVKVSLFRGAKTMIGLMCLRMMRMTLKYGHSDWSPYIFAQYAGFESGIVRNIPAAKRFYYITDTLIKNCPSKDMKTKSLGMLTGLTTLWSQGFNVGIEKAKETYTMGMECGETHHGLKVVVVLLYLQFFQNMELSQLESDARILCNQMKEFKLDMIYKLAVSLRQMVLNLMGYADDPVELTGDVIDAYDFETQVAGGVNPAGEKLFHLARLGLAMHFNSWDRMEELLPKVSERRDEVFRGIFMIQGCMFTEGLVAYKLFWHTGNKKYKKHALWCTKRLESWAGDGAFNCRPSSLLLCAEKEVMLGGYGTNKATANRNVAIKLYKDAIESAKRMEVLQWEALFNERVFQVLSQVYNDVNAGIPYLKEARKLYVDWGAYAKDEWITETYGRYL